MMMMNKNWRVSATRSALPKSGRVLWLGEKERARCNSQWQRAEAESAASHPTKSRARGLKAPRNAIRQGRMRGLPPPLVWW